MELVPARIECTDYEDLFRRRLYEMVDDMASGRFGAPILCLAGLEVEFQLSEPDTPEPARQAAERQARVAQIREEAEAYIQDLLKKETDEATRQVYQSWLPQLDEFNTTDWLNFKLYQEFSSPTPAPVHAPYGGSYGEVRRYSEQAGWLEFRFGQEGIQEGYYDLGANCEIRFAPCSPPVAVERQAIVLERLHQLCAELHLSYRSVVDHLNLSLYAKQGDHYRPIIGNNPSRLEATLNIVTGLCAALEVGTCIAPQTITETDLMYKESLFLISRFRDHARICDDRLEWRALEFGASSTAHKLLWLTAGATFGLECGLDYIINTIEMDPPYIEEEKRPQRTPNFRRKRDLILQRLLDYAIPGKGGRLIPGYRLRDDFAYVFAELILGEEVNRETALALVQGFLYAVDADDEGHIYIDRAFWDERFSNMTDHQRDALLYPIERLLEPDGLRFSKANSVKGYSILIGTSIAGRLRYWKNCEIMYRTYGPYTEAYTTFLRDLEAALPPSQIG